MTNFIDYLREAVRTPRTREQEQRMGPGVSGDVRRVALLVPSLEGGGAERMMVVLANDLARRGDAVDLLVLRGDGAFRRDVSEGVRVVVLGVERMSRSIVPIALYLRRENPQLLVSAMNYVNVVAIAARLLAMCGVRVVLTEHANLSPSLAARGWFGSLGLLALMRVTYPRADAVVAVSWGVARDLEARVGLPDGCVSVINNPVELKKVQALSLEPVDHPWLMPGAPPVVLCVGRLTEAKDHISLVDAFVKLRSRRSARLILLGEGEQRHAIELHVRRTSFGDDILFAGFDLNPYRWMRSARVVVLSSRREAFGNVLVEAMACGTPVVSTDCESGPAEILDGGRWGHLVPVGDVDALARAIEQVIDGAGVDAEQRAAEFGVDVCVEKYVRLMASVVRGSG